MGVSVFPAPATGGGGYKRYVVTLTSGTSWTIPAGITAINATLQGGGGGGGTNKLTSGPNYIDGQRGLPGAMITTYISGLTPGNSITYAIGAGGASASQGGTTTMTGATSASGGRGIATNTTGQTGTQSAGFDNGGAGGTGGASSAQNGGVGGAGQIIIEYWT
jgi:hypothetical protein